MKQLLGIFALTTVLIAMPATAEIEHQGFYIGAGVSKLNLDITNANTDFSGNGFTIYGGYHFTDWFGIESAISAASDMDNEYFDLTAATFSVTPKFRILVSDAVALYAKAGFASVAIEDGENYYADDWGWDWEADYSGLGLTFGIGADLAVTSNLNIRLSYDYVDAELDSDSPYRYDLDTELSIFSLGLHYQF